MIQINKYNISLQCDNCKAFYRDIYRDISYFIDRENILKCAKEDEWININNKHYCPNCYVQGDNDNIIIKESEANNG